MKLLFICPYWGSEDLSYDQFAEKAKKAGYDGVEFSLPLDEKERETMLKPVRDRGLELITQHWRTNSANFPEHQKIYERELRAQAAGKPLFINSHTGRDFFSFEQNLEMIELARKVSRDTGVPIYHETHRSRFGFAAHIMFKFLREAEDLKLSFDLSHWVSVAETYLEDQKEAVDLAVERAEHIHARVGYPEGPQIDDPRVPEWREAVDKHLAWWDRIIERAKKEKRGQFTITPEFGPYPYQHHLPFTNMPISSQWDINLYMRDLLKKRYA